MGEKGKKCYIGIVKRTQMGLTFINDCHTVTVTRNKTDIRHINLGRIVILVNRKDMFEGI